MMSLLRSYLILIRFVSTNISPLRGCHFGAWLRRSVMFVERRIIHGRTSSVGAVCLSVSLLRSFIIFHVFVSTNISPLRGCHFGSLLRRSVMFVERRIIHGRTSSVGAVCLSVSLLRSFIIFHVFVSTNISPLRGCHFGSLLRRSLMFVERRIIHGRTSSVGAVCLSVSLLRSFIIFHVFVSTNISPLRGCEKIRKIARESPWSP